MREKRRPWRVERGERGVKIVACAMDSRVGGLSPSSLRSLGIEGISRGGRGESEGQRKWPLSLSFFERLLSEYLEEFGLGRVSLRVDRAHGGQIIVCTWTVSKLISLGLYGLNRTNEFRQNNSARFLG